MKAAPSQFKNVFRIVYCDGTVGMHHNTPGAAYTEAAMLEKSGFSGITVQVVQVRVLELPLQAPIA